MTAFATQSNIQMNGAGLLGRSTASVGKSSRITIGSGLTLSAGVLSASGGGDYLPLSGGTLTGPITGTGGLIEQRDGLTAQCFDLFETYTSGTNNGKLRFKATSSGHQIGSARASSGSNRAVQLGHFDAAGAFTSVLSLATSGAVQFGVANSSNLDLLLSGSVYETTIATGNYIVLKAASYNKSFYFNGSASNGPGLTIGVNLFYAFSSGTNAVNTQDTALGRNAAGVVEINNGTAGTFRDLIVRNLRMAAPTLIPASASATGSEGQIAWDSGFIYICTASNTWKRVAIATW